MSFWDFQPYVSVAARRAKAAREVEKLRKQNRVMAPVVVEGRKIAQSFWGKSWCDNLERYSDYASRLPRGRSYVRNGSVIDLRIERGQLRALVSGSELYQVEIDIAVAAPSRWKAICGDCAGSVGSLVDLLRGKLSKSVMERVCREADGLFPAPHEIKLKCSCPDWADMCKHVAAVLYGVGARLDAAPEVLFTLRGVDHADLVPAAGSDLQITRIGAASERVLGNVDVAALFGLDMAPPPAAPRAVQVKSKAPSKATAPAPGRETPGRPPADVTKPRGRSEKRQATARIAKKAPRQERAEVTHAVKPRTGRNSAVASGEGRMSNKMAAGAGRVPVASAQGRQAAVNAGSRRDDEARAGGASAANRGGGPGRKRRARSGAAAR
jgi:uncharacterized Zn finger protein